MLDKQYEYSVRNKGFTIACSADNQTEKVGCPHPKSDIQCMFDKHRANLPTYRHGK